jgi:Fe(3+) dicitrate transport protein
VNSEGMKMKTLIFLFFLTFFVIPCLSQKTIDSIRTKELEELTVQGQRLLNLERLPPVEGTRIWSGKKNEIITVQELNANLAEKTPRQIFAKIPGVFVYDMDGSGNQVNISTRGLDPHRGWEFNIRQNDAITNSDMYGYPASHYSMPMEAVARVELVRGTGSLQYGAQFGGMLNYITKTPDTTKAISFETINSAGSYGLLSTYNAIGGRVGKIDYYVYINKRVSSGYRDESYTDSDAEGLVVKFHATNFLDFRFEFAHSKYIYQLPGALNDEQFSQDPRQATRSRNYYSPDIYIPAIGMDWRLGSRTKLSWLTSAVLGTRESVLFDKPADVVDAIDPVTLNYASRQVDMDNYNSYTTEIRLLHEYDLFNQSSAFVAGVQLMNNDLHRRQQGKGTTGSDFDVTLIEPGWGRDLHFKTNNIAVFVENNFKLTDRLSVSPGTRAEIGKSDLGGSITYYPQERLPDIIDHDFFLAGINAQYTLTDHMNFYAGWSQAYRPVILKDIVPSSTFERVDDDLKDADGYNFEAGFRGISGKFQWDVGVFQLRYNNKLGMLSETDPNGDFYFHRTNIGNALTQGVELFAEYMIPLDDGYVSIFTSSSYMDARYRDAFVRVGDNNISVDNNKVESAPEIISRNGLNIQVNGVSMSVLYSYTAESYADALNTKTPSANGSVGLVPAYGLLDINASWRISDNIKIRLNVNNVTNKEYFTKRPQFYPGPGIWPSDGRSFVGTMEVSI